MIRVSAPQVLVLALYLLAQMLLSVCQNRTIFPRLSLIKLGESPPVGGKVTKSIVGSEGMLPEIREFIAFFSLDCAAFSDCSVCQTGLRFLISTLLIVSLSEVLVILARS